MSDTLTEVRSEVAELLELDVSELEDDESLLDFGLDSVRIITLVTRWKARGFEVSFVKLAETPTLRAYARLLDASAGAAS